MEIILINQDIVLIGLFNPSKFDRHTFIKNKILKEDEILNNSLFLPERVNVSTKDITITINPNQLIISSLSGYYKKLSEKLAKILNLADQLSLNASGFNFRYIIQPVYEEDKVNEFIRSRFFNPNNPIQSKYFSIENSMFGFYSSKDFENTRLKLDVKPITLNFISVNNKLVNELPLGNDSNKNILVNNKSLQFEFNYHRDYSITDNSKEILLELIDKYELYKSESDKIIDLL